MKLIDKVALLYIRDRKVLSTLSKGKDTWYFPGGKREGAETDLETLKREIREELNVEIRDDSVSYYGTFEAQAHGKTEGILVKMTCYTADYTGTAVPGSEIWALRWVTTADMESVSMVDKIILENLKARGLID